MTVAIRTGAQHLLRAGDLQPAANRLPTEQAALYALVTGDWRGS